MNEGMRNFAKQYNLAINDPDLIRRYRMVEDGKRDIATKISVAERNTKLDIARSFKRDGIDPAIIAKNTGLSLSEIAAL